MTTYRQPYTGQELHTVSLFGTEWKLPLVSIDSETYIASDAQLVLGDTSFVEAAATELATYLGDRQLSYLVTPEAKALPLTQALARRLDIEYAVVRKSVKDYMVDPHTERAESITTEGTQRLVLDEPVVEELSKSRVGVVDDAVSTGGTMSAIDALLSDIGSEVVWKGAVFEEGQPHPDIDTLTHLPLFIDS